MSGAAPPTPLRRQGATQACFALVWCDLVLIEPGVAQRSCLSWGSHARHVSGVVLPLRRVGWEQLQARLA
eukprot:6034921-Alexandrium_andersonii.AAC.1